MVYYHYSLLCYIMYSTWLILGFYKDSGNENGNY